MYNITIFGINLTLNPVAFKIPIGDGWSVYWYGIVIALGFMLAVIYGYRNAEKLGINVDKMLDVIIVATPFAILCARTYYLIFDGKKLNSFSDFFGFNGSGFSGLAIYGGIIGALLAGFVMCIIKKIKILDMFDLAVVGFLIGQGIGRWGNFFNQEAYGGFTGSSFWGMTSNKIISEYGIGLVHPCFLYESIWCLIGAFVLYRFTLKRQFSGQITLVYAVWYGFGRGFIELLRTDSLMIGNIKVSCMLSFIICVCSAVALVVLLNKNKRKTKETEYESVFIDEAEDTQENIID
jgi:phosphatidylglycerol:prolipoprotein diacylglycerol transferase